MRRCQKNPNLRKIWMTMKLTMVLFFLAITNLMATETYSQATKLTLQVKDATVREVLSKIEENSEFFFLYNGKLVDVDRKISMDVNDQKINEILNNLFQGTDVVYAIVDRQIVLTNKANQNGFVQPDSQQSQKITGTVTGKDGSPLPGVNVVVTGITQGAITDIAGKYSIEVPQGSKSLTFTFIGMAQQEITIGTLTQINVTMAESAIGLDEVIVIGYGTKTRGALTGSIAKVDSKILEARPLVNTLDALQGELPGVTVTRGSGQPGNQGDNIQIRGYSSISGDAPLVLIDGVPGDMNTLNTNDILNITVLKDAAASIYGARAASGVILIATKKGKKGSPTVSYSFNYGIKTPQFLKKMANTSEMVEMYNEGMHNVGLSGTSQTVIDRIKANAEPDINGGYMYYLENYPGFYQSTDWNKVVYGNGAQQMHNISISGGGDKNTYLLSAGYVSDGGVFNFGKNKSDRYNLRLNEDFNLFNRINFETQTTYDNSVTIEPSGLSLVLGQLPREWNYIPVYNSVGEFYHYQGYWNAGEILTEGGLRTYSNSKFATNIKADAKITNDLKLVAQGSVNLLYSNDNIIKPTYNQYNWVGGVENIANNPNNAYYSNSKNLYKLFTTYLDYNKTLFLKHHLALMAGASHEDNSFDSQSITGYNFASNLLFTLNMADKTKTQYANFTGNGSEWALTSYFGRFSYSYNNKYILDLTTRIDGSSKFAPNKRWSAVFPSIAASWNLHEENFIKSLNIFDNLKLRASWGQSGNQNLSSFGNYDYLPLISISGAYPLGSPNVGQSGAISNIASTSRTWETIETTNFGLDFAVLNSKLSGSFDYYVKRNKDMLVSIQLPALLGGSPPTVNSGLLETKGWELSIGWKDKIGESGFKYSITANLNDAKNKLINLEGSDVYGEGLNYARQGYSLYSYFGYAFDGIIKNADQLAAYKKLGNVPSTIGIGDVMYKDVDGDGQITEYGSAAKGTKGDMVYLGNLLPRYTYSSNISVSYKNFELSVFLQGIGKRDGIKYGDFAQPFQWIWYQPMEYFHGKTWTPENPDAKYPRIIPGGIGFDEIKDWDWRTSAMRVDNMAYLKIKVITLAYNIPQSFCSKLKIQSVRVYASGKDLFTISKGTWDKTFNPEEIWQRNDEQTYPFSRVISFGVDIKF
jgi:TonB-linked SusC/RagA family outer membrane protein